MKKMFYVKFNKFGMIKYGQSALMSHQWCHKHIHEPRENAKKWFNQILSGFQQHGNPFGNKGKWNMIKQRTTTNPTTNRNEEIFSINPKPKSSLSSGSWTVIRMISNYESTIDVDAILKTTSTKIPIKW